MLEKGFSLHFEKMSCIIHDPTGAHLMTVAMKDKSFPIDGNRSPCMLMLVQLMIHACGIKDLVILATPL